METHKELVDRTLGTIPAKDFQSIHNQGALTRNELVNLRAKAIRRGIWFKVLSKTERACIELTIKIVNKVRSHLLAKVLTSIIQKLLGAMKSRIVHAMEEIGCSIAQKLSQIALSWGNISAAQWVKNHSFIQYLTVMHMNAPPGV
jgi:hypothetical protein